jgi:DNA-binding response OmpR family regulator
VFTDSISALNNYRPDYYDMIAVNVRVPRMDGFELYKDIKERDNQVRIWYLSAPVENTYEEFRQIHPGLEENRVIRNQYGKAD